ncbi:carboxymuconolactone decarboxylase family protein [Georgenia sp. Marseille-Q6866]
MFIERPSAVGEDLAAYEAEEEAVWGFVPNYAGCFAPRPEVARAWRALNVTIRAGMDRRRYEIASIRAARAVRSTYCTAAHAKALRDVCGDEDTVRAIATGERLEPVDAAVLRLAAKVAAAASVEQSDVAELRALGLSDAEVADVVYAAAARAFFTAVLDGLGARLDPQTAAAFDPELRRAMVVGREPAG